VATSHVRERKIRARIEVDPETGILKTAQPQEFVFAIGHSID
jgi:hypothetical protein